MTSEPFSHVAVLGAGAWGTALAAVAAVAAGRVTLWGREGDYIAAIGRARENARYLPGIALPEFAVTDDLAAAAKADAMLLAVPAQTIRAFVAKLPPFRAAAGAVRQGHRKVKREIAQRGAGRSGAGCTARDTIRAELCPRGGDGIADCRHHRGAEK